MLFTDVKIAAILPSAAAVPVQRQKFPAAIIMDDIVDDQWLVADRDRTSIGPPGDKKEPT